MTALTLPARGAWRLTRLIAWLAGELAVVSLLMLALVPLGWRLGLWHFRVSLLTLMPAAASLGVAAVLAGLLALLGWTQLSGGTRLAALAALVGGAVLFYWPAHYRLIANGVPPIHDISTDAADPPAFAAVLTARAAENGNKLDYEAAVAAQQKTAYPDIAPLTTGLPPAQAFERALAAARAMPGWRLVAADPEARRIEASETSFWMGFTDDVVIRVAPAGAGSRIDVRSVSRQGRGDFGVNAARVRAYLAALGRGLG